MANTNYSIHIMECLYNKLIPSNGIYIAGIIFDDLSIFKGIINIEAHPTSDRVQSLIIIHILGLNVLLKGHNLSVQFVTKIK